MQTAVLQAADRISRIVFLDAIVLKNGESFISNSVGPAQVWTALQCSCHNSCMAGKQHNLRVDCEAGKAALKPSDGSWVDTECLPHELTSGGYCCAAILCFGSHISRFPPFLPPLPEQLHAEVCKSSVNCADSPCKTSRQPQNLSMAVCFAAVLHTGVHVPCLPPVAVSAHGPNRFGGVEKRDDYPGRQ